MSLKYYISAGRRIPINSHQGRVYGTDDISYLVSGIISLERRISSPELVQRLKQLNGLSGYSERKLLKYSTDAANILGKKGRLKMASFEDYVANGYLTRRQIDNYRSRLRYAGITPGHRGNSGVYTKEEIAIFTRMGYLRSRGASFVDAMLESVREVLGDSKAMQFERWHEKNKKHVVSRQGKLRRAKTAEDIRNGKIIPTTIYHFDACIVVYNDTAYRDNPARHHKQMHDVILERLVADYARRYHFARRYPFSLYFELSGKQPSEEMQLKLDELMMQSHPKRTFADYETHIFGKVADSLDGLASRLEQKFETGFAESERGVRFLFIDAEGRKLHKLRFLMQCLRNVMSRYKTGGGRKTLADIGGGIKQREKMRQWEARGLQLLREQPSIERLLSSEFWEI